MFDRDLVLAAQPSPQVDQLAARAAEGKRSIGLEAISLLNGSFADRAEKGGRSWMIGISAHRFLADREALGSGIGAGLVSDFGADLASDFTSALASPFGAAGVAGGSAGGGFSSAGVGG